MHLKYFMSFLRKGKQSESVSSSVQHRIKLNSETIYGVDHNNTHNEHHSHNNHDMHSDCNPAHNDSIWVKSSKQYLMLLSLPHPPAPNSIRCPALIQVHRGALCEYFFRDRDKGELYQLIGCEKKITILKNLYKDKLNNNNCFLHYDEFTDSLLKDFTLEKINAFKDDASCKIKV